MGHPQVESDSPMAVEPLFTEDAAGLPVMAVVVKGTFEIGDRLALRGEQSPVSLAGELSCDAPESSYRYEPEIAYTKPATDVVLVGHARPSQGSAETLDVGLKVGPVQKIVRVFGDRYWVKTGGRVTATRPQPFTRMPLVYERAFGGWDKAHKDEREWRVDRRNPVGCGFGDPLRFVEEGKVRMPNLEDPGQLIKRYKDAPPPAGLGFLSPHWQQRAQFAGTYDETWEKTRKPRLPADFDTRFFNAASPGLVAPGYLKGDEEVIVVNASPAPRLRFDLPGVPAPVCRVTLRDGRAQALTGTLDTVIIDTDEMLVFLLWRSHMRVPSGANDVLSLFVDAGAQRPDVVPAPG